MAEIDVKKIIATGSPKRRLLLFVEDGARARYFQEGLLTDHEVSQLSASFKKPNEIKLWNEFRRIDERVTTTLLNLQTLALQVADNYSKLDGLIHIWGAVENAEQLANSILHAIKDEPERKRIAKSAIKGVAFFSCNKDIDPEGYVAIDVNNGDRYLKEGFSLKLHIEKIKNATVLAIVRYISWEKALLDYMDEMGFNIATYKKVIKQMSQNVVKPRGYGKYLGETPHANERAIIGFPDSKRLQALVEGYGAYPILKELEVDEEEYEKVTRYYLHGEQYPEALRGKENKVLPNE